MSNVNCEINMKKHLPSGSVKQKLQKEKISYSRDAALVPQIHSISTLFNKKVGKVDGSVNCGAAALLLVDNMVEANACTASPTSQGDSNEKFGRGRAALPPTEPSAGSHRSWLSPFKSPVLGKDTTPKSCILVQYQSTVHQKEDEDYSWCETN